MRLDERGLGADVVLETWIGERLIWHTLMELVLRYCEGESSLSGNGSFTPWVDILGEELSEEEGVRAAGLSQLILTTNGGPLKMLAYRWCETAAVSHVVDYRVSGYTETDVEQSNLVLQAGEEATVWVFDRLTVAYLNQWSASSLMWELVYLDNSRRVVERPGVPNSILNERHVSVVDIVSELSNRLLIRGVAGDVIEGLHRADETAALVDLATIYLVEERLKGSIFYLRKSRTEILKDGFGIHVNMLEVAWCFGSSTI